MFYLTEQDKFEHHIKKNNIKEVKTRLKHPDVNIANSKNLPLGIAAQYGHTDILKLFLSDKRTNPSDDDNWAIRFSSDNGKYESVKLLLNDSRVNPTVCNNYAIQAAFKRSHTKVVELLWRDKRVKRTLKKDDPELFNQLIPLDVAKKLKKFNGLKSFNNE
jgi:hypothetical protein